MAILYPVRASFGGNTRFRRVRSFEHAELCRAFELDQASFSFDLPQSAYSIDKSKSGVSGYVLRCGERIGTIHVAREVDRFRDLDPQNMADRLDLRQTV